MRRILFSADGRARRSATLALLLLAVSCAGAEDGREIRYLCDNGVAFTVRFASDRASITFPSLRPLTLRQAPSGSGFRYSDGRRELRGKGREAQWVEAGARLNCQEQPAAR